jgi:hypothetical protein
MSSTVAIDQMFFKSMAARIKARRHDAIQARDHVNVRSSWISNSTQAIVRAVDGHIVMDVPRHILRAADGHIVMDAPRQHEAPSESPEDKFDPSLTSDESSEGEDEANAGDCLSPETYYLMGIVGGHMRKRIAHKLSIIEDMMRVHNTSFGDESPYLTARVVHSTPRKPRLHRIKQYCRSCSPLHRNSRPFGSLSEPARSTTSSRTTSV